MNTISRYLIKEMIKPALVALFIMLSLVWLLQSLRFMDWIINKGLDIGTFLYITVLIIPSLLIIILPLALFSGSVFAYKRLADDSELTSMQANGVGMGRLARPAVLVALLGVAACYSISLYFLPAGMSAFKSMQSDLRRTGGNLLLEEGTFNQIGNDLMVYVKYKNGATELFNLLVHDSRVPHKPVTWMAQKGEITFSEEGFPRLTLYEGVRQEVTETQLNVLEFSKHTIDIRRQFDVAEERVKEAEERYLPELEDYSQANERTISQYKAEYQRRLLWPTAPLPLVLLASVFLARPLGRHSTSTAGATKASAAAIVYVVVMMSLHTIAGKGNTFVLYGQWALPLASTIWCTFKMRRLNKGRS